MKWLFTNCEERFRFVKGMVNIVKGMVNILELSWHYVVIDLVLAEIRGKVLMLSLHTDVLIVA